MVSRASGVAVSLSRRRAGVRLPSGPLPGNGRRSELEVCPTLARSLPLKQVYVGSIPTASTVGVDAPVVSIGSIRLCHGRGAGSTPARCSASKMNKKRAHDVAVAYRLAKADVWVQLPLGALLRWECQSPL
jgi:hypothetical protein